MHPSRPYHWSLAVWSVLAGLLALGNTSIFCHSKQRRYITHCIRLVADSSRVIAKSHICCKSSCKQATVSFSILLLCWVYFYTECLRVWSIDFLISYLHLKRRSNVTDFSCFSNLHHVAINCVYSYWLLTPTGCLLYHTLIFGFMNGPEVYKWLEFWSSGGRFDIINFKMLTGHQGPSVANSLFVSFLSAFCKPPFLVFVILSTHLMYTVEPISESLTHFRSSSMIWCVP